MSIDLHIHSLFSDGTYSPSEIVQMAKHRGISAVSITDHDTLSGTDEAIKAGKELNVEVISGIELSVNHNGTYLHILGYFMDHKNHELKEKIIKLQCARKERNLKIIAKLNSLGLLINNEEIQGVSKVGQTGRPHIAQVLRNKGYVRSINDAFKKYLKKDALAYVSRFVYSAEEAINMIRKAGGFAVLAHPAQIDYKLIVVSAIVDELVGMGLEGLEMYYPTHSKKTRRRLKKITSKHNLLLTGGSDYHGEIRQGTSLAGGSNVFVPPELLEKMKQRGYMR